MSVSFGNGVDLGNLVTAQTNPLTGGIGKLASAVLDPLPLPKISDFIGFRSAMPVQHHDRSKFRGLAGCPDVTLPFTPTAFVFIDPSAATNGSGSYASPLNTIPTDYSLTAGTVVLFKAGTRAVGRTLFNCNNVYFGAYGSGPKPIWDANGAASCLSGANNNAGIVIRDISFVGNGQKLISNGSGTPISTNIAWTILGCSFALAPSALGVDCNAVQLWGAGAKILANVFDGIATDAIWIQGDNCECAYNIIRNVAQDGREAGDCIQITDGINAHIHHNELDHSSSDGKQCVIIGSAGTGAGALVEYNVCRHVSNRVLNSNAIYTGSTSTVRKNIVIGARNGIWVSANSTIESNIIVNNDTNGMGIALTAGAGLMLSVLNNTILSSARTGKYGLRYNGSTSPTGLTIKNNIFQGFRARGVELLAIANVTEGNNCYYDNVSNSDKALAATSFISDPCLDSAYVPQNSMLFQFGTAGASNDVFDTTFSGKCIGAVQPDTSNFDDVSLGLYSAFAGG